MTDKVKSDDNRIELDCYGAPHVVSHNTTSRLSDDLAEFFVIEGGAAAVVGSSGPNQGEHKAPKQFPVLVPMPTRVRVVSGDDLITLDGKAIAHEESRVSLPDVTQPVKDGVIVSGNDFFFVNGRPVTRGTS